jgi:hypothetical protein
MERLHLGPRGHHGAPEVEQVEQVFHLDAAGVGQADREHGGAAADLELAGIELRGVGVGRSLDELDVEAVGRIELLGLDHRRHEGAERRKTEYDDGDHGRCLRGGRGGRHECRECERRDGAAHRTRASG